MNQMTWQQRIMMYHNKLYYVSANTGKLLWDKVRVVYIKMWGVFGQCMLSTEDNIFKGCAWFALVLLRKQLITDQQCLQEVTCNIYEIRLCPSNIYETWPVNQFTHGLRALLCINVALIYHDHDFSDQKMWNRQWLNLGFSMGGGGGNQNCPSPNKR